MADIPKPNPQGISPTIAIIITILAAIASALGGRALPLPTPPDGGKTPIIDVKPNDTPVPVPTPSPIDVPVASIAIKDSKGLPINTEAGLGQMLIFTADKSIHGPDIQSLKWIVEPDVQNVTSDDGNTLYLTTPNIFTVVRVQQIVAYQHKIATQFVEIKCGKGAQPPPIFVDPVPPPTPPDPKPQPVAKVTVSIIEDAPNRPPEVIKVLNDFSLWEGYRQRGNTVRIWNGGTTPSPEPEAVIDIAALKSAGVGLPGIVVRSKSDNNLLYAGKLPLSSAEVMALLGKYIQ